MDAVSSSIEEALRAPIHGWDFSWLQGRAHETQPPWDYPSLVRAALERSHVALDIDTGGGEFLERLGPVQSFLMATEGYPPNVSVAANRLASFGIPVVQAESAPDNFDQGEVDPWQTGSPLPFDDNVFELVVDRHSSYWPSEVLRVLKPGGHFLTQQRSEAGGEGEAWEDLFRRPPHPHERFHLDFATRQLTRSGFDVERAEEADTPMVFQDLAGRRLLPTPRSVGRRGLRPRTRPFGARRDPAAAYQRRRTADPRLAHADRVRQAWNQSSSCLILSMRWR